MTALPDETLITFRGFDVAVIGEGEETLKDILHQMDSRTPGVMHLLNYLDRARARARPWLSDNLWPCRFSVNNI